MSALLVSLARNRLLLRDFVARDLRARYVGSSMGFFWSVIFPFLNLLVYMFVFRMVLGIRFGDKVSPELTALWMLCGITVWQAFAETVSRSTNSLVENQNLIQKVVFPSELLPAYLAISSLINMLIGTLIVILGVVWFAYLAPADAAAAVASGAPDAPTLGLGPALIALPLLIVLQAVFTLGFGYFLAAFNLFLRDTFHLVGVFVTVWMFSTPIFYPPELVRLKGYGWLLDCNPMFWLISSYREILLFGRWPDWSLLARFFAVGLAGLFLGATFFRAQKPRFPDLL